MTPRERLQLSYELALFPPRLNAFWHSIRDGNTDDVFRRVCAKIEEIKS